MNWSPRGRNNDANEHGPQPHIGTKPSSKDGVLAQVALLRDLVGSDVVRRLVREIEANIQ
jgi:hypothetical protein